MHISYRNALSQSNLAAAKSPKSPQIIIQCRSRGGTALQLESIRVWAFSPAGAWCQIDVWWGRTFGTCSFREWLLMFRVRGFEWMVPCLPTCCWWEWMAGCFGFSKPRTTRCVLVFFRGNHARLEHFQSWKRRFFLAVFIAGLWFAHAAMLLSWSRACAESVHLPISDFGAQKWDLGVSNFETYHRHTAKGCKHWYSFKNTAYPLNEYIPVYPREISRMISRYLT